jgi:integrase
MGSLLKQKYKRKNGQSGVNKKWYGEYQDENGRVRRVALSTDKQAAKAMLADLERNVERRRAGFVDEYAETRQAPMEGLVADYLADLRMKGRSARHIADTKRLLNKVLKSCGFDTLGKLHSDLLDRFLSGLTGSARTKNTHRQAVVGFANWLVRKRKLPFNPLAHSTKAEGKTMIQRRALPLAELRLLLDVARERPLQERQKVRSGPNKGKFVAEVRPEVQARLEMEGRQRVLLYKAAFYTGLRRGELKALRVYHLSLDGDHPRLVLPGQLTKNKQAAHLPLRADFATELRDWIRVARRSREDLVFQVGRDVAKHLKRDLKAAGIPIVDEKGRVFDFHALRKCTATYMNKAGVPLTTAKECMRHSTVELTAGVYNDGELHDLRGAVELLPSL